MTGIRSLGYLRFFQAVLEVSGDQAVFWLHLVILSSSPFSLVARALKLELPMPLGRPAVFLEVLKCVERDLPVGVVGDGFDNYSCLLGHLEEGDVVAGVLGHGGEDAISRLEGDRVEGHVPGAGGILDNGNLVA